MSMPPPPSPHPLRTGPPPISHFFTRFRAANGNHLPYHTGSGRRLSQEFSPSNCGLSQSPYRNGGPPPVRGACVSVVPQDSTSYLQIARLFTGHSPPHGSGKICFQNSKVESGRTRRCSNSYGSSQVGSGRFGSSRVGSGRVSMDFKLTGRIGSSWPDRICVK